MMSRLRNATPLFALAVCLLSATTTDAQTRVTTPKEEFGFNFGDDYFLASYRQIAAYWHKLDRESDRMIAQEIGQTAEGRPHLMAIVTSPENHRNLARYREISRRLALAEGLTDDQARQLAKEGKAVVWIDGGLHATETLGARQLGEMVYQILYNHHQSGPAGTVLWSPPLRDPYNYNLDPILSVEYMISLNRAVLDYASRMKENLLFNIYRMGQNSIERGSRDNWTANPKRYTEVAAKMGQ